MTNSQTDQTLIGIFGSETRASLLRILVSNSSSSYNLTELAKLTKLDISGISREIANLIRLDLAQETQGRYRINKNSAFIKGLEEIFRSSRIEYFLLEDIPNGNPLLAYCFMNVDLANEFLAERRVKFKITSSLSIYEGNLLKIYFINEDFKELSKDVLSVLIKNPEIGIKDTESVVKLSDKLSIYSDEFNARDYTKTSLPEMLKLWKDYYSKWKTLHVLGWFQNASDMSDMLFTKHLLALLGEKIRKKGAIINQQDAFSKLTTPTEDSNMQKEYEDLLKILVEIEQDSNTREIFTGLEPRNILKTIQSKPIGKKLEKHAYEYGWLGYGYVGPNWDELYFIDLLSSLIRQKTNAKKLLEEIQDKKQKLVSEQEKIIKSLGLDENEKLLFEAARGFVFAKGYRKDAMFKFLSRIEPFYQEIARRLLISINDLRYCYPTEFEDLIARKPELISKIQERQKFSLWESKQGSNTFLEGKQAREHLSRLAFQKEEDLNVSQLTGTTACPGRVRGSVKIINRSEDMKKMSKGDILVSIATNPDLVPAMKIAGAIVADVGGITCHAAIVSRELNIPCVVGTRIGTKALKDGMLVDVDATHGFVRIIKK